MANHSIFDNNVQKMHEWISAFYERSNWYLQDDAQALAIIRATLHELRDNLPINNLAHLSAQLPLMIRGVLFEKWNPNHIFPKERKKEDFLNAISQNIPEVHRNINIEDSVKAVFDVLYYKINPQEIEKLKKVLPSGIREFFP